LPEGLLITNTILNDHNRGFVLIYYWSELFGSTCLIDRFVGADDVVKSRAGVSGSSVNYDRVVNYGAR
jgi:hypothetical protein